jgi:ElaB/YqjD/DUF883 family membrane-anchored ribosome-binding protein
MAEQNQGTVRISDEMRDQSGSNDGMNSTQEKAQEYGEQARDKVQEYGERAQEQAEKGREQTATGMEKAADMMRERTENSSGMPAEAGAKAADALDNASGYLRSHETSEILGDVESYAKAHPGQALAGAIFAGFVLGRILR